MKTKLFGYVALATAGLGGLSSPALAYTDIVCDPYSQTCEVIICDPVVVGSPGLPSQEVTICTSGGPFPYP